MHMSKSAKLLSCSTKSSLSKYSMPNEYQSYACIYIFRMSQIYVSVNKS